MSNNQYSRDSSNTHKWLNVVETSMDTSNLRFPTEEEMRNFSNEELSAALQPFVQEKLEMRREALHLMHWVGKEIHPAICRFSTDVGNKSKAELEAMILELRCLQYDTEQHRAARGQRLYEH